jgi:hypothetical protein
MPRQAKINGGEGEEGQVHETATNGFQRSVVEKYVKRCENLDAKIDAIHTTATKDAQPFVDDRKEVIKEAAEKAGIPKAEFRALLRKRKLLRRAEQVSDSLNENQQLTFEQLQAALGMLADTPLGQAASDAASPPA